MKVRSRLSDVQSVTKLENRLAQALFEAGHFLSNAARPYAPVDTGALRASIGVRPVMFHGVLHESTRVSPGVHYDIYQELGTYKMAAHPYLKPSTRDYRDKIIAIIVRGVTSGD